MNAALAAEIARLSPAEKLLLVEELWNEIARDSNAMEPPAWHDQALGEDAERYTADPSRGDTWENAKRRITGKA
jgi:putative addiction module component (TIGR02574 family)